MSESQIVVIRSTVNSDVNSPEFSQTLVTEIVRSLKNEISLKRTKILTEAITLRDELDKVLKKFKPDDVLYIGNNNEEQEVWKKQTKQQKDKTQEGIINLDNAFNAAIELGTEESFTKLNDVMSKVKNLTNANTK